jgi:hypothetical protein
MSNKKGKQTERSLKQKHLGSKVWGIKKAELNPAMRYALSLSVKLKR